MLVVGGVSPMESEGFYGKIELHMQAKIEGMSGMVNT